MLLALSIALSPYAYREAIASPRKTEVREGPILLHFSQVLGAFCKTFGPRKCQSVWACRSAISGHKKRARSLRVLRAAQRVRPRARALFRPESAGREGRPQNNGGKRAGGATPVTHARRAMKVMRAGLWPTFAGGG